jgi:hypothetical protein
MCNSPSFPTKVAGGVDGDRLDCRVPLGRIGQMSPGSSIVDATNNCGVEVVGSRDIRGSLSSGEMGTDLEDPDSSEFGVVVGFAILLSLYPANQWL